jgi:hypothetical protein
MRLLFHVFFVSLITVLHYHALPADVLLRAAFYGVKPAPRTSAPRIADLELGTFDVSDTCDAAINACLTTIISWCSFPRVVSIMRITWALTFGLELKKDGRVLPMDESWV